MARTFMIHVALHWTDYRVDDIALWPFAIKHAAWLYIRLPNQITGISPLEMLTQEKATHEDLLQSHVWGCPTFVLVDPIAGWQEDSKVEQAFAPWAVFGIL